MTLENLENLVRVKQLKHEAPDQQEFDGLVDSAKRRLKDAAVEGLSEESRFSLTYGAAHGFSLAALRWHGYRSDNRYLVFQCLKHTVELSNAKWRVLDLCHKKRNIAEYEGHLEIAPSLLQELTVITGQLARLVESLGPVQNRQS